MTRPREVSECGQACRVLYRALRRWTRAINTPPRTTAQSARPGPANPQPLATFGAATIHAGFETRYRAAADLVATLYRRTAATPSAASSRPRRAQTWSSSTRPASHPWRTSSRRPERHSCPRPIGPRTLRCESQPLRPLRGDNRRRRCGITGALQGGWREASGWTSCSNRDDPAAYVTPLSESLPGAVRALPSLHISRIVITRKSRV